MKFLLILFISFNVFSQDESFFNFPSYFDQKSGLFAEQEYHKIDLSNQENNLFDSFKKVIEYTKTGVEPKQEQLELVYDFLRFYLECQMNEGHCKKLGKEARKETLSKALVIFRTQSGFTEELANNPLNTSQSILSNFTKKISNVVETAQNLKRVFKVGKIVIQGATPLTLLMLATEALVDPLTEHKKEIPGKPITIKDINPAVFNDFLESIWISKFSMILDNLDLITDDRLMKRSVKTLSLKDYSLEYFEKKLAKYSRHSEGLRLSKTGIFLHLQWNAIAANEITRLSVLDNISSQNERVLLKNGGEYFMYKVTENDFSPDEVLARKSSDENFRDYALNEIQKKTTPLTKEEEIKMTKSLLVNLYQQGIKNNESAISAMRYSNSVSKLAHLTASPVTDTLKLVGVGADIVGSLPLMGILGVRDITNFISNTTDNLNSSIDDGIGQASKKVFQTTESIHYTIQAASNLKQNTYDSLTSLFKEGKNRTYKVISFEDFPKAKEVFGSFCGELFEKTSKGGKRIFNIFNRN